MVTECVVELRIALVKLIYKPVVPKFILYPDKYIKLIIVFV